MYYRRRWDSLLCLKVEIKRLEIHLDKQIIFDHCQECSVQYMVVRGSIFDSGKGIGLYLIALHGHSSQTKLAHLAIALIDRGSTEANADAVAMDVVPTSMEIGFSLVNWEISPWRRETYLGRMLSPDQVRESPRRDDFFHVASHVVQDAKEVADYFTG
jgi:hypothetical protein